LLLSLTSDDTMADSDSDEFDLDFIGGAIKNTHSQIQDFRVKNWRKKDDTTPKKAASFDSPDVTPLKRPLAASTKHNLSIDDSPQISPRKTTKKQDFADDSLDEGKSSSKGRRGRGKKNAERVGSTSSASSAGKKATRRSNRSSSSSNSKKKTEEETEEEKQARLTKEALAKLDDACARAARLDDLDSSVWSDCEVVDVTTPSGSKGKRLSVDDLVVVKIRWKYGTIIRTEINKTNKLGVLFDRFCSQVKADPNEVVFSVEGRDLKRTDTVESATLTVTTFVDASERDTNVVGENEDLPDVGDETVELKVQSSDRKRVERVRIRHNDKFEVLMLKYAEVVGIKLEALRFIFDGEVLNRFDTPEDLDLEGGECIDAHVIKPTATQPAKGARRGRKNLVKPLPAF